MSRVDHDHIRVGLYQFLGALHVIARSPHGCPDSQASMRVLGGAGVLDLFLNILDRDEALQLEGAVNHQ